MHNVESLMIRCDSNPWEKSPKFAPSIFFLQSQLLVEGIPLANWQEILGWSESGSLEKPWGFCIETSASLAVVTVIAFKRYCCLFGSFYHFWSHAARIYKYPEIHFVDLLDACTHKSPWNRLQFFGFQQNHGTKNHRTERPVKPNSWSIWSGLDLSRRRPTRLGEVFFHVPHPIFIKKTRHGFGTIFFRIFGEFWRIWSLYGEVPLASHGPPIWWLGYTVVVPMKFHFWLWCACLLQNRSPGPCFGSQARKTLS